MADGEGFNWMRSMQACHDKHIGGPPPLHRRIAYEAAYATRPPIAGSGLLRRIALLTRRLVGRSRRQAAQ